ncbi:MAG: hypothetical protein MUP45_01650 [Candidatus Marinimicrobia bacterium]|nr:hypothetical protein [Candidatus Neomarinimicrobiota bacterium]
MATAVNGERTQISDFTPTASLLMRPMRMTVFWSWVAGGNERGERTKMKDSRTRSSDRVSRH